MIFPRRWPAWLSSNAFGGVGERDALGDREAQRALFGQLHDRGQSFGRGDDGGDPGRGGVLVGHGRDRPGQVGHQLHRRRDGRRAAEGVDRGGDRAKCPHPLDQAVAVADRFRADRGQVGVVGFGGRPDDAGPQRGRDLHRDRADTTGRAMDEHGVADPDPDLVHRGVGGGTGDRQRRRLLEIDVRRLREQRAGLDVGLGAVCTGEAVPDDLVAHREPFDAWTDRLDHPGCLVARNGRELPSTAGLEIKPEGRREPWMQTNSP